MNLKLLSDEALLDSARATARKEREYTQLVIAHLMEVSARKLHLKRGYPTLWDYVVKELGYDTGSAQRRIGAMRLMTNVPEAEAALKTNRMSLTSASMLSQFFQNERRHNQRTYAPDQKRQLLSKIEGLSTRDTERTLRAISPQALPRERERAVSATETALTFVADAEMMNQIARMKELLSGSHPNPSLENVFRKALAIAVEKLEKKRGGAHEAKSPTPAREFSMSEFTPAPELHSAMPAPSGASPSASKMGSPTPAGDRAPAPKFHPPAIRTDGSRTYISVGLKRQKFTHSQERCTYVDPHTGRRCDSRRDLQIDHVVPVARGGSNAPKNLTILCGAHNRLKGENSGVA